MENSERKLRGERRVLSLRTPSMSFLCRVCARVCVCSIANETFFFFVAFGRMRKYAKEAGENVGCMKCGTERENRHVTRHAVPVHKTRKTDSGWERRFSPWTKKERTRNQRKKKRKKRELSEGG